MSDVVQEFIRQLNKEKDATTEDVASLLLTLGIQCEILRVNHEGKKTRAVAIVEPSFERLKTLLGFLILGEIDDSIKGQD